MHLPPSICPVRDTLNKVFKTVPRIVWLDNVKASFPHHSFTTGHSRLNETNHFFFLQSINKLNIFLL